MGYLYFGDREMDVSDLKRNESALIIRQAMSGIQQRAAAKQSCVKVPQA